MIIGFMVSGTAMAETAATAPVKAATTETAAVPNTAPATQPAKHHHVADNGVKKAETKKEEVNKAGSDPKAAQTPVSTAGEKVASTATTTAVPAAAKTAESVPTK